jgi:hypothetical protein
MNHDAVDPSLIDRPVRFEPGVEPPSWTLIAVAWGAGLGLIFMVWSF